MTPEQQGRIQVLRAKSREGTLTLEEMREAIIIMRQDRVSASQTSARSKATKSKTAVNSDDLLSELE
jgi:hypothetical protein